MTAYRYFRFTPLSNGGGGVYAIAELTAHATVGGANVLTGGTASASSTFGGAVASQAFDGNPSTIWASIGVGAEHLDYDLGVGNSADVDTGEMSLAARNDNSANQTPVTGTLSGSNDAINYTTIFNFSGVTVPTLGQIQWAPAPSGITYFDANNRTASVLLSPSTLVVASSSAASSVSVNRALTGKHYAEVVITTLTGTPVVGIVNAVYSMSTATLIGGDANSVGYRSGGAVVANGVTLATLGAFVAGDRIGVAIDPANRLIWFRVNNGNWNNNALNNPATGVGGIDYSSVTLSRALLAVGFSATGAKWTGKFASASWTDTAPSGYASIDAIQTTAGQSTLPDFGPLGTTPSFSTFNGQSKGSMGQDTRSFSPAGAITRVSGLVEEGGTPVQGRRVEVYDRDTSELLGRTVSAADGSWSVIASGRPAVRIVGSDPTAFNSLVYDDVVPV